MQTLTLSQIEAPNTMDFKTGAVAFIFVEDAICLTETITHHVFQGFKSIFCFGSSALNTTDDIENCYWVDTQISSNQTVVDIINQLIPAFKNQWIYYSFNAEFLYFPFSETRKISDFTSFLDEEKRTSAFCTTIDLYTKDIKRDLSDFDIDQALFDSLGYYSHARQDNFGPKSRQIDVFGGLRWRFEQYIPWDRRRINNMRLFKSKNSLKLDLDFVLNEPEYETYQSEWHNSPTIAVCSFRAAKFLLDNPDSRDSIERLDWPNSVKYQANADQLLEMGLMEPGQWF